MNISMDCGYLGVSVFDLITITYCLFGIGVYGIISFRNDIILILISIELMFLSLNANFIFFSLYLDDLFGQIFALFILTVAASESVIGLAILVAFYRLRKTTALDDVKSLKG